MVYNIPVSLFDAYRGRDLIVRSHDPSELVQSLAGEDLGRVAYLQIIGTGAEIDCLMPWGHSIPLDLVIQHPEADLPLLYRYSPLRADRPVRVSVPVLPGFSKVVKLAAALNFAVKLEGSQPEPAMMEEMLQVVLTYLHQALVSQPIEYFHSMFLACYQGHSETLWDIQEEDPARIRYITDDGIETLSARFVGFDLHRDLSSFVSDFRGELLADKGECCGCEFFENCSGYFKWPRKEYRCDGVRTLFQTLQAAAEQLKADLASFHSDDGGKPP
jgi:hypothetical protein